MHLRPLDGLLWRRYLQQLDTADRQEPSEAFKTKTRICSPARFMPWSEIVTAAGSSSSSSSCSTQPIHPRGQSS
jgi:hypothetical protein